MLDELMDAIRPPDGLGEAPPAVPGRPVMPAGVRPDRLEAIEWLLSVPTSVTVVVDGHNVAFDLGAASEGVARERVIQAAARLRRLADGPRSVTVYFDTSIDPQDRRPGGVTVRFVPDADEAIAEAVAGIAGPAVVVTTDRGLRERAEATGAITVWGSAFVEWMRRR